MTPGLIAVMFVAVALVGVGVFAAAWRRERGAALAALPVGFAGVGVAFAGVSRFAATGSHELAGQEIAVLVAVAALALTALGVGIAGREAPR